MTDRVQVTVVNASPIAVNEEAVREWTCALLSARGVQGSVSVAFVGLEEIAALNEQYRGAEGPTDVLSFGEAETEEGEAWIEVTDTDEDAEFLGDIVIAPEVARENALADGVSLSHELRVLIAHGVLHLLGLDHESDEEEAEMLAVQDELVATLEQSHPADLV